MVVDKGALLAARQILWYGKASVRTIQMIKDPVTKVLTSSFVTLLDDIPCKLSHKTILPNEQSMTGPAVIKHSIKVSLPLDTIIPTGSQLIIEQNGYTGIYKQSGKAAVFMVHQEVPLIFEGDYA